MRYRILALAAALAIMAAGCNRKPVAEAEAPVAEETAVPVAEPEQPKIIVADGFRHQAAVDASGFYLSPTPLRVGNFELAHIGIGAPSDFKTWEQGDHGSTFGPILIEFDNVSSPRTANELAGENRPASLRVLPEAYSFDAGKLTFRGRNPTLGVVLFSGTFDQAALNRARAEGAGQDTVLRGELKVGDEPVRQVSLFYWAGD